MKINVISNDRLLIETFRRLAGEESHELSVTAQWPPAERSAASLVFLDLQRVGRPSEVEPGDLQQAGDVILICPPEMVGELDEAILAAARDLLVNPIPEATLRFRLRNWDLLRNQRTELEKLGGRVDELAAEMDRRLSARHDVELRDQLQGRQQSRLEQVLSRLQMVTRLSRVINCLDLQTIVEACITRVPVLVNARFASLYFHDQKSGHLILERHNHPWKIAERIDLADVVNSPMSLAIQRKKLVLIRDFKEFEARESVSIDRHFIDHYETGSCIIAPLMSGERVVGVLNLADKKSGESFDAEIDLPPIEQLCELIGASIYNIELFREVERQAKTDSMTGLANHRSFVENLTKEFERANRYGSRLSLLMVDIDAMKEINDTHGHQAGDAALAHVAGVVKHAVRTSDVPARYGGDEFAVILVETGLKQAQMMAGRLLKSVQESPLELGPQRVPMTLSIGVGQFNGDQTPEHFIRRVDAALYAAKDRGRNQVADAEEAVPPPGQGNHTK